MEIQRSERTMREITAHVEESNFSAVIDGDTVKLQVASSLGAGACTVAVAAWPHFLVFLQGVQEDLPAPLNL